MSRKKAVKPTIVKGWALYAHPLFIEQIVALLNQVEREIAKGGDGWTKKRVALRPARITEIVFDEIPTDPTNPRYRQGKTLGPKYKHWFRDNFYQRYRLFFRFSSEAKVIVYAWVNDDSTLRDSSNSKNDAYEVFKRKLEVGKVPDRWRDLLAESESLAGDRFVPGAED